MSQQLTYEEFESTFTEDRPESDWPDALRALWFAGKDEWDASHDIAQDMHTNLGSWIHAYLHRVEGDKFNAGYWYRMAGKPYCNLSLKEELRQITEFVLKN